MDVVDLLAVEGRGPAWGTASEDLNATLLVWRAGEGQPAHVNDACDVALLALAGSGSLTVDGEVHELAPGTLAIVPRGTTRMLVAGAEGLRCVSVHRRRGGLAIAPRAPDSATVCCQATQRAWDVGVPRVRGRGASPGSRAG